MVEPTEEPRPDLQRAARRLLRAARSATLATRAGEQPFASLVTPAVAPDGTLLLLLSDLSEHTRHLRADGRCALMAAGPPTAANPQTAPRVTVTGRAAIDPDPALRARWVALHPYAAFYAGFADFNLWRLQPDAGLIVAGFGRAQALDAAAFQPDPAATAAIAGAERRLLAQLNEEQAHTLSDLARAAGAGGTGWRAVACDAEGLDLAHGDKETALRLHFPNPLGGPAALLPALAALAARLRGTATRPRPDATLDHGGPGQ